MANTKRAVAYPHIEQYNQWEEQAEELGYHSTSQFMQDMVEAGSKKFTADVAPDETNQELRQHRNELKKELDKSRDRIRDLEQQLYNSEKAEVEQFIEDNPGTSFGEIVQNVIDTAPERVNRHLDELEGDSIEEEGDSYYSISEEESGHE